MEGLEYLRGPVFEPLSSRPLRIVTIKTSSLLSRATARRVGEIQALSHRVAFQGSDISLTYLPEFVAKTELERNSLPRSFLVKSLSEFVGDLLEERLLCPVRAVRAYLNATSSLTPRPQSFFVLPCCPSRSLSKNLRQVISDAGAIWYKSAGLLRAHSVRGVVTSAAFLCNWSVFKVLEAGTWGSNPVFASFYFKDLSFTLDNCSSLGPFVVAGSIVS